MTAVGDIDIATMTRSDVMRFRFWLSARIEAGEIGPYSANRDIYTLGAMCKAVLRLQLAVESLKKRANLRQIMSDHDLRQLGA